MKFLTILVLFMVAQACVCISVEKNSDKGTLQTESQVSLFDKYCEQFNKSYSDEEYKMREQLFLDASKIINEHNAMPGEHHTKAVNEFADWTKKEKESLYGLNRGLHNFRKRMKGNMMNFQSGSGNTSQVELAHTVDWTGTMNPVPNQRYCGSCWAFAAIATLEGRLAKQGHNVQLSVQNLVSCTPNEHKCGGSGGCDGATVELAYDFIMENGGVAADSSYSYTSGGGSDGTCKQSSVVAGLNSYYDVLSNDLNALMVAVQSGPVAVSVDATNWEYYDGKVFMAEDCGAIINHAVTLVGYGTEDGVPYWLIRNSWGAHWGVNGHIKLERKTTNAPCTIDTHPEYGTACEGGPTEVEVCGTCGILYSNTVPVEPFVVSQ